LQGWPLMEAALVAARFLHFAVLFGLALFPLYSRPSRTSVLPTHLRRWLRTSIFYATLLGLASALAWAWFAIVRMTGTILADADDLFAVLRETSFGQIWVARLALGVALLMLVVRRSNDHDPDWALVLLTGVLLASLALLGHTQTSDGALWV